MPSILTDSPSSDVNNIQVSIRVRPISSRECSLNSYIIIEKLSDSDATNKNQINLYNPKFERNKAHTAYDHRDRYKTFTFDHCYLSLNRTDEHYASQQIIFNDIGKDVLKSFIEGYNTCILCYGQTGTGKTFTMMGKVIIILKLFYLFYLFINLN
jgi:type IV secretory pathway ATPase VirB11/archaellum biosynthesis ATPase